MVERRRAELPGVDILFGAPEPEGADPADGPDEAPPEQAASAPSPAAAGPGDTGPGDAGQEPPPPTPLREAPPVFEVDHETIADLARVATEAPPYAEGASDEPDEATAEVGTLLGFLVAATSTDHAIELGASSPTTSLWMAGAMGSSGVLTTISGDGDVQTRLDRALRQAEIPAHVRTITGEPEEVLPRLSDGGYDLLVAHGAAASSRRLREHAARLLRPGGTIALVGVAAAAPDQLRARRALVRELVDDPRFQVTVIAVGGGVALGAFAG